MPNLAFEISNPFASPVSFLHTFHALHIMSFFGFEQPNDLEEERRRIREGGLNGGPEDLAVYTWGEESYDGLGDALQEGGDELNDETFGGSGAVGECTSAMH